MFCFNGLFSLFERSVFYKMDFCDPKELASKTGGGVAVLKGRKVSTCHHTRKGIPCDSQRVRLGVHMTLEMVCT